MLYGWQYVTIIYTLYILNDVLNQIATYSVYDAKAEKVLTNNFITDGILNKPYSISSDPVKKYIFIGTSDYKTDGDMYVFNTDGKLIKTFDKKVWIRLQYILQSNKRSSYKLIVIFLWVCMINNYKSN